VEFETPEEVSLLMAYAAPLYLLAVAATPSLADFTNSCAYWLL